MPIFSASTKLANRLLGVGVEVIGLDKLEPAQSYVFTPNHRSHIDIAALMPALLMARFAPLRQRSIGSTRQASTRAVTRGLTGIGQPPYPLHRVS